MIPILFSYILVYAVSNLLCKIALSFLYVMSTVLSDLNPFAPGDFSEKRVLTLVELFSGHCRAIKS